LPALSTYRVSLEQFTGPLGLLLHLIRSHEMDIFDLDIAWITDEYLRFIEEHGVRDLTGAYEFLAMAATLVELKSRLLLPGSQLEDEPGGEGELLDPREELVRRLVAYQSIQDVTAELESRFEQAGRHWPRQIVEQLETEIVYTMDSLSVYDLMSAFNEVMSRPRYRQVSIFRDDYDLEQAREWITRELKEPLPLVDMLARQGDVFSLIVTFVALLEMIKEELLSFSREGAQIMISPAGIAQL
jgi:segregation and condensation protein A